MDKKNTKLVSLQDAQKFYENPFILELNGKMFIQPRANYVLAKKEAILDKETGFLKHDEDVLIGRKKYVDKSQFAKIYASEIGILFELSKTAINVFLHLSKIMNYDNMAIFNYLSDYNRMGYKTHHPALNGLRELLTKKIIAVRDTHIYWLNPVIVCKGERFATYTEYIAGDDPEKKQMIKNKKLQEQADRIPTIPELEFAKEQAPKMEEDYQKNK